MGTTVKVKMIITEDIINQLNKHFKSKSTVICFVKGDNCVNITIKDMYLDFINVYPNRQFYKDLEDFLESKGIYDINYNNTKSCFWKFGYSGYRD